MPLVVTEAGSIKLLYWAIKAALAVDAPLTLGLFVNDYQPTKQTVYSDFTQPSFAAYWEQPILRANWEDRTIVAGRASSDYGSVPFEWTNGGASATVYGYFVRLPAPATVLWAERFNVPRVMTTGKKLLVQLRLTSVTEFLA